MNIIEAVKTGKPFQRNYKESERWWSLFVMTDGTIYSSRRDDKDAIYPATFTSDDILAEDWEVKE